LTGGRAARRARSDRASVAADLRVVTADPAEAKRFLAGTLTCGHEGGGVADRAVRGRPIDTVRTIHDAAAT